MKDIIEQKLEWLKELIDKLIEMNQYHNKSTPTSVYEDSYAIGGMLDNISLGKLPRKKQLIKCNDILKSLKRKYKFSVDWRGDITDCDEYTDYILNNKVEFDMNLILSSFKPIEKLINIQ